MFFCALSVIGCGKEEPTATEASLSSECLVFSQAASSKTVTVTYKGSNSLSVSSVVCKDDSWCSAEAKENSIVVTVIENETESIRHTFVTVSFDNDPLLDKVIEVSQESGSPKVLTTTAVDGYKFNCRGGEYCFSVKSSEDWKAELVDCDWASISVSKAAATVTVTVPANDGDSEKTGKVRVVSGANSCEYSFAQECKAQDKYLALLGEYDIYGANWYSVYGVYSGSAYCTSKAWSGTLRDLQDSNLKDNEGKPFTRTCTLVEDKYGSSYLLKDFLFKGMAVPVNYDNETDNVEIPSMWNVGYVTSNKEAYPCFLVGFWMVNNNMRFNRNSSEVFKGTVSEDGNTITITTGLNLKPDTSAGEIEGSGLCVVYMDMSLGQPVLTPVKYSCLPYGPSVELRRIIETTDTGDSSGSDGE